MESPADLAAATRLGREFGDWAASVITQELGIEIPPDVDHPTWQLDEILAGGGRMYLAEVEGTPIGLGGLKLLAPGVGEIKRMYVRPEARGLGAGRAIVERLLADARELGLATVYLESAFFMHSAHALYRSVGFEPCDAYPDREFEGVDHDVSVFMRLDLKPR
jgi:GNAT superfamily N-acetyltransferase